ncbi:restriction endonuclease subunit S [Escherichia coli]|uniref:restriction endonuclease subunit S n=1 Tax=Escherichia coli TaxID=562 RepID=UPI0006799798|nr:restriction endonuclease subunit S [Escherichia coli]EFI6222676.1 restriction endonuclease subunit S [Escherichia coli]EGD6543900.1 restriction endonuclease subunit S [Escherichia coli]EGF7335072.1 restriction endonuclease subunit S [Escherichia coli]EHO2706127.1 restriction endonuclease subunit S [Escherichia coli]EHT7220913.1 restriction endonuclease subunit S [Escherichia coli]
MSGLNFLNKLLDGVDVEWLSLGELGDFIRGNGLQKKDFVESGFPAIHYGQIYTRYGLSADKTFTYVLPELANKLRKAQKNDLLLATTSENDEDVVKPLAWLGDNVAISGDMMLFRHEQNVKYLAYFFQSEIFQTQKMKYITGAKVRRVSSGDLSKIKIPIPCSNNPEKSLAIQSEIVRILDKFTALTAELTAELNMRKKQYNYYRDQLLSFKEGEVEWKSLEDIALFRRGSFPQPYGNSEWYDGEGCMPFVQVADVADSGFTLHTKTKQQISKIAQSKSVFVEAGTIVVTLQGTIGRVAITQYDCYVDRTLAIFTNFKVKINKKYFAYQLKAKFDSEKEFARGSTLKTITKEEFSKFQLPLPSINEQNRIVSLLDKFDTLAHSIKQGLPREIELRQKQYEYYRDLLFSFPKPETVSN